VYFFTQHLLDSDNFVGSVALAAQKYAACDVSVAYILSKSRTERPRNTKISTELAHVNRTPLSRSKKVKWQGHSVAASRTVCYGATGVEEQQLVVIRISVNYK